MTVHRKRPGLLIHRPDPKPFEGHQNYIEIDRTESYVLLEHVCGNGTLRERKWVSTYEVAFKNIDEAWYDADARFIPMSRRGE